MTPQKCKIQIVPVALRVKSTPFQLWFTLVVTHRKTLINRCSLSLYWSQLFPHQPRTSSSLRGQILATRCSRFPANPHPLCPSLLQQLTPTKNKFSDSDSIFGLSQNRLRVSDWPHAHDLSPSFQSSYTYLTNYVNLSRPIAQSTIHACR